MTLTSALNEGSLAEVSALEQQLTLLALGANARRNRRGARVGARQTRRSGV